jgi:hypothetical protein
VWCEGPRRDGELVEGRLLGRGWWRASKDAMWSIELIGESNYVDQGGGRN